MNCGIMRRGYENKLLTIYFDFENSFVDDYFNIDIVLLQYAPMVEKMHHFIELQKQYDEEIAQ